MRIWVMLGLFWAVVFGSPWAIVGRWDMAALAFFLMLIPFTLASGFALYYNAAWRWLLIIAARSKK